MLLSVVRQMLQQQTCSMPPLFLCMLMTDSCTVSVQMLLSVVRQMLKQHTAAHTRGALSILGHVRFSCTSPWLVSELEGVASKVHSAFWGMYVSVVH